MQMKNFTQVVLCKPFTHKAGMLHSLASGGFISIKCCNSKPTKPHFLNVFVEFIHILLCEDTLMDNFKIEFIFTLLLRFIHFLIYYYIIIYSLSLLFIKQLSVCWSSTGKQILFISWVQRVAALRQHTVEEHQEVGATVCVYVWPLCCTSVLLVSPANCP